MHGDRLEPLQVLSRYHDVDRPCLARRQPDEPELLELPSDLVDRWRADAEPSYVVAG
jgi:hypothetical protein